MIIAVENDFGAGSRWDCKSDFESVSGEQHQK
jgi:hypothetical protein